MYIPAWPSLNPTHLLTPRQATGFPYPLNSPRRAWCAARYGIYHLFRALHLRSDEVVLVPDYHHGNEVLAVRAAGASICFYSIGRDLQPDLEQLERLCKSQNPRVLYVIHYLGWPQPILEMDALCRRHGMLLVEDCALALLSEYGGTPLGAFGDYAVFCLYKTLPVPNGGLLVWNRDCPPGFSDLCNEPCGTASVASRCAELMLESLRARSNGLGAALLAAKRTLGKASNAAGVKRVPVGNSGFDPAHADLGAWRFNGVLLDRFDYEAIRRTRRANYLRLLARLADSRYPLCRELGEGICPLFLPVLVRDKHAAAQGLWRHGIVTVEFWNEGDPAVDPREHPDSCFLRRHVLELPIHQGVTPEQVDRMADALLSLNLSL